jgi:type II secretory pathway pseudopilin PulG
LVVTGIVTGLIVFLFPKAARLRLNQRDAKIIAELQEINLQIQAYRSKKGVYPSPVVDDPEKDAGVALIDLLKSYGFLPPDYNPKFPIFYQVNYQFKEFKDSLCNTISQTESESKNLTWVNQKNKLLNSPIADLNKMVCQDNAGSYQEMHRQFYGVDLNPGGKCSEQAKVGSGSVGYRLGAALYAPEPEALRDATPCTDRFFDIVGY